MKKTILTIALSVASVAAFAQGKLTLGNDANHLIQFSSVAESNSLAVVAAGRVGAPVGQINGTADVAGAGLSSLTLQLFGGTSAGSLTLRTTLVGALMGNAVFADGRIGNTTLNATAMAGLPGGSQAFFQLQFFSTAAGSFSAAVQDDAHGWYYGASPIFSVVPGATLPSSMVSAGAPSLSTWAAGPVVLVANPVPEPSSMALAGLGAASLLIFRRRK